MSLIRGKGKQKNSYCYRNSPSLQNAKQPSLLSIMLRMSVDPFYHKEQKSGKAGNGQKKVVVVIRLGKKMGKDPVSLIRKEKAYKVKSANICFT